MLLCEVTIIVAPEASGNQIRLEVQMRTEIPPSVRFVFPAAITAASLLDTFAAHCNWNDSSDEDKLRAWPFEIPEPGEYETVFYTVSAFDDDKESRDYFKRLGADGNTALFIQWVTQCAPEGCFRSIPPRDEDLWSDDPARQRHNLYAIDAYFGPDFREPKPRGSEGGRRHALSLNKVVPWSFERICVGFRKVQAS